MVSDRPKIDGYAIADCVARFRAVRPHVHCITNSVAQHFTANVLLAAGATPSMTIAPEEVSDFVHMADALLINLGTMDDTRSLAVNRAVQAAQKGKKVWALDPVFVQASPVRLELAQELLGKAPDLLRCNRGEYEALFHRKLDATGELHPPCGTTIALTGKTDLIGNGSGRVALHNGSALMDRVTTMGCALTGLAIGFMAVEDEEILAVTSAMALYGLAGEQAELRSDGPGTFVPYFLDALCNLSGDQLIEEVRLS
ncbi:MAG: hydroxyethylthiazole kinase [Rhizobiaceae bacterium]